MDLNEQGKKSVGQANKKKMHRNIVTALATNIF